MSFDTPFKQKGTTMTIATGDKIPTGTFKTMTAEGPTDITSDDIFAGKKVLALYQDQMFDTGIFSASEAGKTQDDFDQHTRTLLISHPALQLDGGAITSSFKLPGKLFGTT